MRALFALVSLFSTTALASPQGFVSVGQALRWEGGEYKSFEKIVDRLKKGFDYICGDVFCEGEYWNLTTVNLDCSLNAETRQMGECLWTIAGSNADIDPATGKYVVDSSRVFECRIQLSGSLEDFLKLSKVKEDRHSYGYDTLRTELPGSDRSAYDQLSDCL